MDTYKARLRAALRGVGTSEEGKALSVYDVGLGNAVCKHRTLQEQIRTLFHDDTRVTATTLSIEDAYLDLLRRGLTNFLHADWQNMDWRPYLVERVGQ